MITRDQLSRYVAAVQLDRAAAVMQQAEVYSATDTFGDGFPVATAYLEAAAELVRVGLLAQPKPGRFTLAASREVVL